MAAIALAAWAPDPLSGLSRREAIRLAFCDCDPDLGLFGPLDAVGKAVADKASKAADFVTDRIKGAAQVVNRAATAASASVVKAAGASAKGAQAAATATLEGAKAAGRAIVKVAKAAANNAVVREAISWAIAIGAQAAFCLGTGGAVVFASACLPGSTATLKAVLDAPLGVLFDVIAGRPIDWTRTIVDLLAGILGFLLPFGRPAIPTPASAVSSLRSAVTSGSGRDIAKAVLNLLKSLKPVIVGLLRARGDQKAADALQKRRLSEAQAAAAAKASRDRVPKALVAAARDLDAADKVASKQRLDPRVRAAERSAVAKVAPGAAPASSSPKAGAVLLAGASGFFVAGPIGAALFAGAAALRRSA